MNFLKHRVYLIVILLIWIILYPKFPLIGVGGSFVAIRLEDFIIGIAVLTTVWFAFKDKCHDQFGLTKALILYIATVAVATFGGIFILKTITLNQGLIHWVRRIEYLSLFWVGYFCIKQLTDIGIVKRALVAISIFVCLYGLGQLWWQFPVITTTNSEFSKGLALTLREGARLNSTFAGHYDLAAFCVIPLLFLFIDLLTNFKRKWLLLFPTGLIYWIMLLSASRVAFAATIFCLFIVVVRYKKYIVLPFLAGLTIMSIIISPQLLGRYRELLLYHVLSNNALVTSVQAVEHTESRDVNSVPDALKPTQEDRSLNIRLNASWPKAWLNFSRNPITGSGLSVVGLATDNDYLRLLAESGILGFLAFMLILWKALKLLISKNEFSFAVGMALLAIMINALFIDLFEASKIATLLWLLIGIAIKNQELYVAKAKI